MEIENDWSIKVHVDVKLVVSARTDMLEALVANMVKDVDNKIVAAKMIVAVLSDNLDNMD